MPGARPRPLPNWRGRNRSRPGTERISFTSIVCALDEADAIGATLAGHRADASQYQVIVSLRDHDAPTIAAVRRCFERTHPARIKVVIAHYDVPGKHAQLNGALPHCYRGDYIGPIDSEDDVAPELLVHVEALIRRTNADIVQGAVQLMNLGRTWQEWYKVHNVEEYRAWYSSRMAFQVSAGFVPLGGNTVYTRASLLRAAGGWAGQPDRGLRRGRAHVHAVRGQGRGRAQPGAGHQGGSAGHGLQQERPDRCSGSASAGCRASSRSWCRAAGWTCRPCGSGCWRDISWPRRFSRRFPAC